MGDSGPISTTRSALSSKALSLVRSVSQTNVLHLKHLWVWPILAALLLGTIGWFLRGAVEQTLHEELQGELQTILDADVKALQIWMRSQEQMAASVASDPQVREAIKTLAELSKNGATTGTLVQSPEMKQLREEISPVLKSYGFDGFIVANRQGQLFAAQSDAAVGFSLDENSRRAIADVFAGKPRVSRPLKSPILLPDRKGQLRVGVPTMFVAAPVLDEQNNPIAALGVRIRPEKDFEEVLRVARAGKTGETYAFDRQGVLLSGSRFADQLRQNGLLTEDADSILNISLRDPGVDMTRGNRPAQLRSEQPLTHLAEEAIAGRNGVDLEGFRDYRGVPTVGAWTWLEDYDFGVGTQIDTEEAFRPLWLMRKAFWSMFALLGAASAAIFLFTVVVARLSREAQRSALKAMQLGQYVLDEKLGQGGMGVVSRAHHAMLQRPTAVKFIDADKTNDQSIARFEREVKLTSQLVHPNTIAVYDYGRSPDGIFYYAMEYLDGISLEDLIKRFGPQPDGRVVWILEQVCASLAEAHGIGLIHRDIKPANILINLRGGVGDFVKVLDFGLVKVVDSRKEAALTASGAITGTPLYVSPEAISRPNMVDARSDLYAVGAVGYFLLTGTPVFDGNSVLEVIRGHAEAKPDSPSQRRGTPLSPELERLILRCLEKDPADRPQTADILIDELSKCRVLEPWTQAEARQWWSRHRGEPQSGETNSATNDGTLGMTVISGQKK